MPTPLLLEIAKAVTQILAFLAAAAFFAYKAITGYLIVNVSLSGKIERSQGTDANDYLAISATVKKGSHGSLELHDARTKVTWVGGSEERELEGIERLSFQTEKKTGRKRVVFTSISTDKPLLRLTPEEEATFSTLVEVPRSAPCIVKIVITGMLTGGGRVGQWRTSMVSLPLNDRSPKSADSKPSTITFDDQRQAS
jgi:hypothetical protein